MHQFTWTVYGEWKIVESGPNYLSRVGVNPRTVVQTYDDNWNLVSEQEIKLESE